MKETLFDFTDYRSYLKRALPTKGKNRGSRVRLAEALGVQKGFISAVLYGNAGFNLEQAFRVSLLLSHTDEEREYFLLLVQLARAGSKDLSAHFRKKIDDSQIRRRDIRERIHVKASLSELDKLTYYSSWHYTAIHMCLMIPTLQNVTEISRYLGLPLALVSRVLEFFVMTGIAQQRGATVQAGPTRIHLPSDSPFISKHHTNWRMQGIQSLDRGHPNHLHYSSVMSISKETAEKIRAILLESIQSMEPIVRDAKDEGVYALTLDLFDLKSGETQG